MTFRIKNIQIVGISIALFIAVILRLAFLDRIPMGMSDDELDYVLTAQSVSYSGKNLDGTFTPFSFQSMTSDTKVPSARAPYMMMAPIYKLMGMNHTVVRIPYAIISIGLIVVIIGIAKYFFGNTVAVIVAFVAAVNPWSVYFGRTAFEAPLAVFFAYTFLLSLFYFRGWWILLSIVPWIFGLYSYQGTNIVFPFLFSIGLWYVIQKNKCTYIPQYVIISICAAVIFSLFLVSVKTSNAGGRMSEIISLNNQSIILLVDNERKNAIQTPYNAFFSNRLTMSAREFIGKYFGAFSTKSLFVMGEERSTFSMWTHGWFYYLDCIFLLFGFWTLFRKHKKIALFLLALILIAPVPAALSTVGTSYALRVSLLYPVIWIIIAVGIFTVFITMKNRTIQTVIVICYGILVANFLHTYFIRNPVNNSEGFGFSNRVLSSYIKNSVDSGKSVIVIGSGVSNMFRQYIFWTDTMDANTISSIQNSILHHDFRLNNISFVECGDVAPEGLLTSTVIAQSGKPCPLLEELKKSSEEKTISQLGDSGRIYEIYNDQLCDSFELSSYQSLITMDDLNIEKLPANRFCQIYISKPKK